MEAPIVVRVAVSGGHVGAPVGKIGPMWYISVG